MSQASTAVNTLTVTVGEAQPVILHVTGSEPAVIRLEVAGNSCCGHTGSAAHTGSYTYTEPAVQKR